MSPILTQINIYPIKSLGGISLHSANVEKKGLQFDRRWMLVDETGMFFTQRQHPQMALLQVSIDYDTLKVTHKIKDHGILKTHISAEGEKLEVIVWENVCPAIAVSKEADEWLSSALDFKCRLVFMPEYSKRPVNPKYAPNDIVSFADGFPFLIIGEASLDLLNSKLKEKLPMNRFRPNFVFGGGGPHEEDEWKKFKIGEVIFYGVKPSDRCVVTTVNQDTAQKGKEPLKTLAAYRRVNNEVLFGQNLICESEGVVNIGDEIKIIDWK